MAAAIRLSRWHLGLTGENPSVGCLVVAPDGAVVGRGVTALGGRPHAEIRALQEAGPRARGATVYATLEPCSHIGRAPPCADAIVAALAEVPTGSPLRLRLSVAATGKAQGSAKKHTAPAK